MISEKSAADVRTQFLSNVGVGKHSPTIFSMAGIPGAGKTTFVNKMIEIGVLPSDAFVFAPDEVMEFLREYEKDLQKYGEEKAFQNWELNARELTYEMYGVALAQRMTIIKDMGCVRQENYNMLEKAKQQGYKVDFSYIYCPPDIAFERAKERERFTPEDMFYERYESLKTLLPLYRELSDEFSIYDNSDLKVPFRRIPNSDFKLSEFTP